MAKRGRPAKADERKAAKWLEKLERAKDVKKAWKERFRVDEAYAWYEGRCKPNNVPAEDWVNVNLMYASLQAELPSLYAVDPYFYVKLAKLYQPDPQVAEMLVASARIRQAAVNYLKTETKLRDKARLAIQDAFFQFGILKTHYEVTEEENPRAGQPIFDDDGLPMLGEDDELLTEPETIQTAEAFKVTRIHPDDFLVDADAGPMGEDVAWKAHRIKVLAEDLKKDTRYKRAARYAAKPTEISDDEKARDDRKYGSAEKRDKKDADVVVLWEIWDLRAKQWLVIAEGYNEDFLLDPEPIPPGTKGDPFQDLRFTLRDSSWYPYPPMSPRIDAQTIYSVFRSQDVAKLKNGARMYEVAVAYLEDESELTKLEAGEDGTVIRTTQPGVEVVKPIRLAPIDQNIHVEINYARRDFEDLATGSNARGAGSGVESATEAGIIEKRIQLREGDRQASVVEWIGGIGKALDDLVEAHWTEDLAVAVSGPEGEIWAQISPAAYDLQGIKADWHWEVHVGATQLQTPDVERSQWMAFLQLLGAFPHLLVNRPLLEEQARMHHIENRQMIDQLVQMGQMILGGQVPPPGGQGSTAGVADQNTARTTPGLAMGGVNNFRGGPQ